MKEAQEIAESWEVEQALGHYAADACSENAIALVRAVVLGHAARHRMFPQERSVGRSGDMAPLGRSHMTVLLDGDNDAGVAIWDQERGDHGSLATIEFCTSFGGGKSPRTRDALVALMVAMEADNASNPRGRWPPDRSPKTETAPDAGADQKLETP